MNPRLTAKITRIYEAANTIQRFARAIPLPWFRLPLNRDVLSELRSNVILSKQKFLKRYGHLIDVTHVA